MFRLRNAILLLAILASFQAVSAEWEKQRTTSFSWLHDVFFISETKGWIVGSDGTIMSTTDGGSHWTQTPKFTTDSLLQVHFTDENTGWILCERNVFTRGQSGTSYLRKTTDGGRTWEQIEFESAGCERVTRLLFNKQGWGTAFGEGGIFYKLQEDGRTWKKSLTAIHFLLLGGAFSDGPIGAISGAGGTIMFTEDNGLTWGKATLLGDTDIRINSLFFVGQKQGWAVGSNGSILNSTAGGRLWRTQTSGTDANLNDVYFVNSHVGWAVGDDGTILKTQNGGSSWYEVNSRVKHRLEKVFFIGSRGWAVGFGGTILTYTESPNDPANGGPTLKPRS